MSIESTVISGAFNVLAVADSGTQVAVVMMMLLVAAVFMVPFLAAQSGDNQRAGSSQRQPSDNSDSAKPDGNEPSLRNERYFERNRE
jgi:hypothetical protein